MNSPGNVRLLFLTGTDLRAGAVPLQGPGFCVVRAGAMFDLVSLAESEWTAIDLPVRSLTDDAYPVEESLWIHGQPGTQWLPMTAWAADLQTLLQGILCQDDYPELAPYLLTELRRQTADLGRQLGAQVRAERAQGVGAARNRRPELAKAIERSIWQMVGNPAEVANLSLDSVCAATRSTRRTAQRAISEYFGVDFRQLSQSIRLHCVRSMLRESGGDIRISDLATAFGFWHFGRFSAAYQKSFGERPSSTLARAREGAEKEGAGFNRVSATGGIPALPFPH